MFKWSRGDADRVSVMFPAEPFFNRCIDHVLDESRAGKSVLAWGDPEGLTRLKQALTKMHIPIVPFGDAAARRTSRKRSPTLSLNLLDGDEFSMPVLLNLLEEEGAAA